MNWLFSELERRGNPREGTMADKKLTREQAQELYDDLSRAMAHMHAKKAGSGRSSPSSAAKVATPAPRPTTPKAKAAATYTKQVIGKAQSTMMPLGSVVNSSRARGNMGAYMLVALFCCAKVAVSALEAVGVGSVEPVQAAVVAAPKGPQWSKEEAKVLMALDHRRSELEDRAGRLEQRELEFSARDRDLALRLTELKELSERLKIERQKGERQRDTQLDQLANVYGSMNPPEAAHLLEQLDIQIAQALIERMPEKRIGQILALMNAQRALELTNRLSRRSAK
jgi:flagellar motility protein MotE (MotC chaperone)